MQLRAYTRSTRHLTAFSFPRPRNKSQQEVGNVKVKTRKKTKKQKQKQTAPSERERSPCHSQLRPPCDTWNRAAPELEAEAVQIPLFQPAGLVTAKVLD